MLEIIATALTVETTLSIGLSVVSAVVVTLFGLVVASFKAIKTELIECRKDRKRLWEAHEKLWVKLNSL